MTATVKVREVLRRVSVLLNDQSPQFVRWPETELVDWLNDAQVAITKFLPAACSRMDVIKLKPGTRQSIELIAPGDCKPSDGSTPSAPILGKQMLDFVRNMGSNGTTPGRVLRLISREMLDSQQPNWHAVTGPSVATVCYDPVLPKYFFVWPGVPAANPGPDVWVEIGYTADPIKIPNTGSPGSEVYGATGGDTTVISVSDEYVDDLVNYVVARANQKDAKEAGSADAEKFSARFTGSLNAKATALTGNNPNLKWLPGTPGTLVAAQ